MTGRLASAGGILILITEVASHGGIQNFNRLLIQSCANHVARTGSSLSVISLGEPVEPPGNPMPAGVALSCAGGSRRRFIAAALREVMRSRPTIVIAGLANFAPLALATTWLRLADQYVVQLYGAEVWDRLSFHRRVALRNAAMLMSITEATASKAQRANGLGGVPVRLLSPVVDDVWLSPPRISNDRPGSGGCRLLSVARLDATEKKKGIDDVFSALTSPALSAEEIEYVVVGEGTDRARLEALADGLGLNDRIHFMGALDADDLRAEFERCDVFVMPSTQEGFGIVFLEAMACGKPVIATRFGGVSEVVVHGETGLLIEPGDAKGLVRALRTLLDEDGLRRRLGEAGRRRVESCFTTSHFQQSLGEILDELDRKAKPRLPLHSRPRPVRT